jgi:4-amino-4-deoxy-L-arabinose transferase-like glycosyltransferase
VNLRPYLRTQPGSFARAAGWGLLLWIVVFWRLGFLSLLDPDEAHYAQLTREMWRTGSWFVPRLDGAPYIDKPVLFHWLQGLSVAALGESEFANRLPNALSAVALIAMVRWAGGHLFDRRTGEWAAVMFATIPATFALTHVALLDMTFATCLFGGLSCLLVGTLRSRPTLQYPGFALISLAIMTKGPVALVLVVLFALVAVVAGGEARQAMRRIAWVKGLGCALVGASPWFVWLWLQFGDRFVHDYLVAGNLWYFTQPVVFSTKATSHSFYLRVFAGAFFPWSLIAIAGGIDTLRARRKNGGADPLAERGLWLWLLVVLGFFTAARFKLDHYIFPAAPACCLLAAASWRRAAEGVDAQWTRGAVVAIAATFLIGGVFGSAAIGRSNLGLGKGALLLPVALCSGGAWLLVQIARRRWSTPDAPSAPVLTLVAVYATVVIVGIPALERSRPSSTLGPWVRSQAAPDRPLGVYRLEWGSSIRYYADRPVVGLQDPDAARAFLGDWPNAYIFVRRDEQAIFVDADHDVNELVASEAIVGRTGRFIRRQVWGAITVVKRQKRSLSEAVDRRNPALAAPTPGRARR